MALKVLIFLLPALVCGQINVDIEAGRSLEDCFVQAVGSTIDIISDTERNTFQINDYQLKNLVERLSGAKPDGAYVRSPTEHDLYNTYGWNQVQRTLRPISAKVLSLNMVPQTVATKKFRNHSRNKNITGTGTLTGQRETTASTTWSRSYGLSVGQEISYSVSFGKALNAGGKASFDFSSSWGSATTKSETMTVGSGLGVDVNLVPGQKVVAVLSASLGTLDVEVEYEATLRGKVPAHYPYPHKGHYFYAYDINELLMKAGLPTSVRSTEIIKVGFYADEQVTIHDLVE